MLAWSVEAALASEPTRPLLIAAPPGFEEQAAEIAGGRAEVLAGGATRAESVRAALERVETDLVAIHDAARPLVAAALFDAVFAALAASESVEAAIAAAPLGDTVKRAKAGARVGETIDRRDLWGAQTPQAFRTAALKRAQEAAEQAGALTAATDEAMLIERAGGEVLLVPSPLPNLKVTLPADLGIAEALLLRRAAL